MKISKRHSGASLLTAVFLITALALLGALMTRLMVLSSTETIQEWYAAQSLYAAESGVDWAASRSRPAHTPVPLTAIPIR
jgi:hypothetical protein